MRQTAILLPLASVALISIGITPVLASVGSQSVVPSFEDTGRGFLADLQRAGTEMAVEALARWITASRSDAIAAGVLPVPEAVRVKLAGHIPNELLKTVRYRVGTGHEFSLQTNAFQSGNAVAITLDDVILFRSAKDAEQNVELWAHELHHVVQYDRWGVRGFAQRYVHNHQAVEAEAETEAQRIGAAILPMG